jgi:hypothetical protein
VVFSGRRHGRQHESEADSMGLVFMKNTSFDISESIGCLKMLDIIDKDTYNTEEGLRSLFNFTEYPFQERWVKKEAVFFGISADSKETGTEEDSLKTHPDCKIRIAKITPAVELIKNSSTKKFITTEAEFKNMQELFSFETLPSTYKNKSISRCLYLALQLNQQHPGNAYIIATIGNCFNLLYENQKNHTLNQIVSLPSPYWDKNYSTLLEFIQNIRLEDMAALSYYFLKQYETSLAADKDFAAALKQSKLNFKNR